MSLWFFMIGVSIFYYLFVTYAPKSKKASPKHNANKRIVVCDGNDRSRTRLSSMFKRFILNVANPADRNSFDRAGGKPDPFLFRSFVDRFQSFHDVTNAMKEAGLQHCQLILGIDFTASNSWQGRDTFKGYSLHHISNRKQNPYQHIINVLQLTLKGFIDISDVGQYINTENIDKAVAQVSYGIHAFGFGDSITKDESTFPFREDGRPCSTFAEVLDGYVDCVNSRTLGGPTSYAPVIHKAIEIVEKTNRYHVLVIIADGQFVDESPTVKAIVDASYYPLSIIVVGVGDGPWDILHQFDDWLPQRQFDNFQFVEYSKIMKETPTKNALPSLALHMFMEIPDQYKLVQQLGYISPSPATKISSGHNEKFVTTVRKKL